MSLVKSGDLGNIDIAVLAGGLGTRIQGVLGDTPKILAPINGRPFLDHLLFWLASFGARRVVLCLGHFAEAVLKHVKASDYGELSVSTIVEPSPLGTGGAIVNARPELTGETIMLLNGDSWISTDLNAFLAAHRQANTDVSVLCVAVPNTGRFGCIEINRDGTIDQFVEKNEAEKTPGIINGGIYLISQKTLDRLQANECKSLEKDFLEKEVPGKMFGYNSKNSQFIDIGVPADLAEAAKILLEIPCGVVE